MQQHEDTESSDVALKKTGTLDTIPDDVAAIIAEKIKAWAEIEGSPEEREKATR